MLLKEYGDAMKQFIVVLIAVMLCMTGLPQVAYAKTVTGNTTDFVSSLISIKYSYENAQAIIKIAFKNYRSCNVMRLTGKDRLVIDLPNTKVSQKQHNITVNGTFIKTIRISQFEGKTCRIVADVIGQPDYEVKKTKTGINFIIKKSTYKNIVYSNNNDRVTFILSGAVLTNGGVDIKSFYTGQYDATRRKYIIKFPGKLANLGIGTFKINDSLLNYIKIENIHDTNETVITIAAKSQLNYNIMTRDFVKNTAITILKPTPETVKLIVIDPGHGGNEPGAISRGLFEKNLNLDIAMRTNALLKRKGARTYIIREEDSYVDLFERTQIANKLKATLFLSIHNNAMEDKNFQGTMTLYYPSAPSYKKFSSKDFAAIIQKNLLANIPTIDRKIVERPNLVVLRDTNMTAALAEIAYLTNATDRNKLKSDSFKQKTAIALSNSVLEALKKMK
jgi:N-acetylmuramoyl-L-alanine amidase